MEWTKTSPAHPGWYWNKGSAFKRGGPMLPIELIWSEDGTGICAFSDRHDEWMFVEDIGGAWSTTQIDSPD